MECIRAGKGWALVVGDAVYAMEGRMSGNDIFAGEKARVTGRVVGGRIIVRSVGSPSD
jgi:hypothetical protein